MTKYLIATAGLAALLAGCSPRPAAQWGEFDSALLRAQPGGAGSGSGNPAPTHPTSKPETSPGVEMPESQEPMEEELFLPRHRYQTLHI